MAKKTTDERHADVLKEASTNIASYYDNASVNLENFRDDKEFVYLNQWDDDEVREFARLQKPRMTMNKLYDYCKRVSGEVRDNTPNLEARSAENKSPQQLVDIVSGLIRKIAYNSNSDVVYETAFDDALVGGFGAFRVDTEYVSADSFEQRIVLKAINDPQKIFYDPEAKDPTKSDGDFCGYYESISKEEFKKKYPNVRVPQSFPQDSHVANFKWGTKESITLVEYYRKEWRKFTIHKLSDGRTVTDKEYKKIKAQYEELMASEDITDLNIEIMLPEIIQSRKTRDYKIMCYKMIKNEILETYEWPSKYLPIVIVLGDAHIINGQEHTVSFVRFAKSAQKYVNYVASETAQAIKNSRREQFIGTPENVDTPEILEMWRNPSQQQGILIANRDTAGQLPQRLPPSDIPRTLLEEYRRGESDIASITGFFEANRGAESQEISGVAIGRRERRGNLGVAVYINGMHRGILQGGKIIASLIPKIYDTERKVQIQMPDGSEKDLIVNKQAAGDMIENNLKDAEFDVIIKTGPSFAAQREEALEILVKMVSMSPQTFPLVSDLLAESTDLEITPRLVERLKTLVPPDIIAKEKGLPPPPPQPNPQMMAAQQEMQFKEKELQLKEMQMQLDAEKALRQQQIDAAKTELEAQKLASENQMTSVKANAEVSKAHLDYQADVANAMAKIMNAHSSVSKHSHETARELMNLNRPLGER